MNNLAVVEQDKFDIRVQTPWFISDILQDDTENRQFYITKGLGSGGTYGSAIWHITMCLINDESRFSWAIAPTFQQVSDTLIPTFGTVLQDVFHFQEGIDYEIIRATSPRLILKVTGQEVHFKSANRPERMVGASLSHITMTEPGLCPAQAFEKSAARLRCPKAKRLQRLFEGTPEGLDNRWAEIANIEEGVHEDKNARRITVWTEDNVFLKPSYVQNLKNTYEYDPSKIESYLYGRFVPFTKGSAYWEFAHSRNVVLNVQPSKFLPLIMAWDFGVSPLPWVAIQRQPHRAKSGRQFQRFVALAEGTGKARGIMDACAEFVAKFDPLIYKDTPIEIDGGHDGYNGSMFSSSCAYDQIQQILSRYYNHVSVVASRAAPRIEARLNKVAALMAYELYVVAAWNRNLIKSHTESCLKDGTWELQKKEPDVTHFADAACAPLFRLTKDEDLISPNAKQTFGTNKIY